MEIRFTKIIKLCVIVPASNLPHNLSIVVTKLLVSVRFSSQPQIFIIVAWSMNVLSDLFNLFLVRWLPCFLLLSVSVRITSRKNEVLS